VGQICTAFTVLRDADIPTELRATTVPRHKMKLSLGIRPEVGNLVASSVILCPIHPFPQPQFLSEPRSQVW